MAKRFYISVDNEGVGGVTSGRDEGRPGGFAYATMREWMTGVERSAPRSIRSTLPDILAVSQFLTFLMEYSPGSQQ